MKRTYTRQFERGAPMLQLASKGKLKFYTFSHFEATGLVEHGFTTRAGGVSTGPYADLNTAFHVGDTTENVLINRALACQALNISPENLVAGRQVHGDRVEVVDRQELGRGALAYEDALPDTDALVTAVPGVPLSSYYADCVPLFFLDPVKKVIALAHAGWKGTVLKIGRKTVETMVSTFGSDPRDCLAGIGPSVGPCCYEVTEQVMDPFKQTFSGWQELARGVSSGKWRLDLWKANRRTLLQAGLAEENIAVAGICTSCHNRYYFSYRAQLGRAGRMAALMMLKERKG